MLVAGAAEAARPLPPPRPDAAAPAASAALPEAAPAPAGAAPPAEAETAEPATPAAAESPRRAALAALFQAYAAGRVAEGDALAAGMPDEPAARIAGEWLAIRAGAIREFPRLAAFLRENPGWPDRALARRRAEEAIARERPAAETVIAFFARGEPETGPGVLALARAFREDGAEEDAAAILRAAWRDAPLSAALEPTFLAQAGDALRPVDHRVRFERMLFREDWEGARRMVARLPEAARGDLERLLALRQATTRRAANAGALIAALPAGLASDPSALFSKLRHARAGQDYEAAARILASAPTDPALLVDGDAWWNERRIVARSILEAGDAARAYAIAANHAARSPAEIIEAEWTAGWIALTRLRAPDVAATHFARAAEHATLPISIARVAHWRARAAEAQGDRAEAQARHREAASHPIAFYGQLSLVALGETRLPLRAVSPDLAAARERLMTLDAARAVALLDEAGLAERAIPLYGALGRTLADPELLTALGDFAAERGDARGLLALGRSATYRGLPLDPYAFPILGIPAFDPVAEGVDPALVYAIARQESAFHAAATSVAGARGLMQLMPATARRTAGRFGLAYSADRLLTDPAYNATLGSAHLAELLEEWGGSYVLVFAAYNAGGGAAARWIARFGDPRDPGVDPVDWIEQIPFPETRNYVQRVMENYQVYRARLDPQAPLSIAEDLRRGRR